MAYKDKVREVRVKGVPPKTSDELKNIASHQGVTLSSFLKTHLMKIADSYPQHLKLSMPKD